MKIMHRIGNLFHQTDLPAWAHGVNCAGAMGKGIAVTFKAFFPEMFLEYQRRCYHKVLTPGEVFAWEPTASERDHTGHAATLKVVYNLATQVSWKTPATRLAIAQSVEKMAHSAHHEGIKQIGMPRIGAGLGGLMWSEVEHELMRVCAVYSDYDLELIVVTP